MFVFLRLKRKKSKQTSSQRFLLLLLNLLYYNIRLKKLFYKLVVHYIVISQAVTDIMVECISFAHFLNLYVQIHFVSRDLLFILLFRKIKGAVVEKKLKMLLSFGSAFNKHCVAIF